MVHIIGEIQNDKHNTNSGKDGDNPPDNIANEVAEAGYHISQGEEYENDQSEDPIAGGQFRITTVTVQEKDQDRQQGDDNDEEAENFHTRTQFSVSDEG